MHPTDGRTGEGFFPQCTDCTTFRFVDLLFLVAMPGAPSSILAPSSKARSP